MAVCGKKIAATPFALYMGISNLGYVVGSALMGLCRHGSTRR